VRSPLRPGSVPAVPLDRAAVTVSMCRSAQRRMASSGSVRVRPVLLSEYSTVTGTVACARRATSPSCSRLRSVCVSIFWEMPSIPRSSSPKRCGRPRRDGDTGDHDEVTNGFTRCWGEGNVVLVVSEGSFGSAATSLYDLLRVKNSKVAEHWDTIETIPERSAWKTRTESLDSAGRHRERVHPFRPRHPARHYGHSGSAPESPSLSRCPRPRMPVTDSALRPRWTTSCGRPRADAPTRSPWSTTRRSARTPRLCRSARPHGPASLRFGRSSRSPMP